MSRKHLSNVVFSNQQSPVIHDTEWVANSDWTNTYLGDTPGQPVVHNLGLHLANLHVQILISTTGLDSAAWEIKAISYDKSSASPESAGLTVFEVDTNTLTIKTGSTGITYIQDSDGTRLLFLDSEAWYYRIIVTVKQPQYTPALFSKYDIGWVNCSDWTNQHLGTTVGGNVVHSLNAHLRDLDVKILVSSDGTDENSFEMRDTNKRYDSTGSLSYGFIIFEVDKNNIKVQTGEDGCRILQDDGHDVALDTQNWYYRIVVRRFLE